MDISSHNATGAHDETSELHVPQELASVLRAHQISALHFVWKRLVDDGIERVIKLCRNAPLVERVKLHQEVFGCIIGHSMGLGKTITALSFLLLLQKHYSTATNENNETWTTAPAIRVIVLTPRSCTYHWWCTAEEWMRPSVFGNTRLPLYTPLGTHETEALLLNYYREGGILFLGYEEYRRLLLRTKALPSGGKAYPRVYSLFDRRKTPLPLTDTVVMMEILESPDMVIFDESHRLKRPNSRLVTALTHHLQHVQLRLALTGTPLQNHLEEYGVMHSVVTGRAVDPAPFRRLFTIPIERGQCSDSTYEHFVEMQKCVASLRRFFSATVHPCGPEVLKRELPERREYVILVGLSPKQEEAYHALLRRFRPDTSNDTILRLHGEASHLCCHPQLSTHRAVVLSKGLFVNSHSVSNGGGNAQVDGSHESSLQTGSGVELNSNSQTISGSAVETFDISDLSCTSSSEANSPSRSYAAQPNQEDMDGETFLKQFNVDDSPKLNLAISLLYHIVEELGDKVVLFSTYKSHLFLILYFLSKRGITAEVLHGTVNVKARHDIIERFSTDASLRVLLCSTKALGVGINLVAANHCILFDVSWNPADDTQATYRLYRYGQNRPVTIYRIATEGTFEHVVFFYALSKSWIHKKIVDVSDPARYERHMKENYFLYPCPLPVEFGKPQGKLELRPQLPNNAKVQESWKEYALQHCPAVAQTAVDGTLAWVRSIGEYSFFVRDSADEVIKEMGMRFEAQRQKSRMPIVMDKSAGERRSAQERTARSAQQCEPSLHACLSECAEYLIAAAERQQRQSEVGHHLLKGNREELSRNLTYLLAEVGGMSEPEKGLTEIVTVAFHRGVDHVMQNTLSKPPYAKLRSVLNARALEDKFSGNSLQNALKFRPCTLFAMMAPTEVTYTLTELGFTRLFVPHCTLVGMRCAISSSDAPKATLRALYDIFKCIEDPTVEVGNDDKRNIRADDVERVVLGCLEEYWPPYANMVLPPIAEGFARRRLLTERAYRMARDHVTGFLTVKEAACYVGVTPVAGRENVYQCQRCADGLLERTAPEYVLKCGRCHYNAEFDVLARNETHHACTVYQLSVVCGLLNSFSYPQSFKKSFIPSECRGALHALKQLRGVSEAGASHQFISSVIGIGVDLLLSGLPETTLGLLRVQCGAPDVAALRDIFTNDSNYLWTTMLRIHVRQTVTEWLKSNTVSSGGMHIVTMPEALIVMAFQSLVKNFKGDSGYAKDVLRASKSDSPDSNVALLLFICESVVRMTYVERLLARPLTRAALDVFMVDYATPSENSNRSMSACTTDGVLDHCSGVKSEVVEPKSVASDEDDGRSLSPETAAPVSSFNRGRKRQRSPLPPYPRSAADSVVQSDSSFSPFYSDDESVEMSASAIRAESIAFETIDEGDVKMVRSAYFWASHCEVYGIGNMEEHTVEIEEDGVKSVVQPPPASFWAREVHGATHDGMLLTNVINDFVEKLLALSATVRAVK